jgi:hypothetical protein
VQWGEISDRQKKKADRENSTLGLGAVETEENAEMTDNAGMKRKGWPMDGIQTMVPEQKNEDKSLVLLQVNCRGIYNEALKFMTIIDMCNPNIIGMASWIRENTEFRNNQGISQLLEETGMPGSGACLR